MNYELKYQFEELEQEDGSSLYRVRFVWVHGSTQMKLFRYQKQGISFPDMKYADVREKLDTLISNDPNEEQQTMLVVLMTRKEFLNVHVFANEIKERIESWVEEQKELEKVKGVFSKDSKGTATLITIV